MCTEKPLVSIQLLQCNNSNVRLTKAKTYLLSTRAVFNEQSILNISTAVGHIHLIDLE